MRRLPLFGKLLRRLDLNSSRRPIARRQPRRRLEFECLENRCLMAAGTLGTIGGTAFIDANNNGVLDAGELGLPGVNVTLTGTTSTGLSVNQSTTTNAGGGYQFISLLPGTYNVTVGPVGGVTGNSGQSDVFNNDTLAGGQTLVLDAAFSGLGPQTISLRMFLTTSTAASFPDTAGTPGQGTLSVFSPTISNPITAISVAQNASPTTIDLAGHFADKAEGNTTVALDVTGAQTGTLNVQLFDQSAPQTVANFLDYVKAGDYNNSIFHRLVTSPSVLQGGGFTVSQSGSTTTVNTITSRGTVANEFGASNTPGTLAMAQTAGDINSATDEFYFNVGDNSASLDPQKFTVFGKVADSATSTTLNQLATTPTKNESSANPAFTDLPLSGYNGTNFPSDASPNNFLLVKDVRVTQQNDFLTYSVVSNSNPTLVTPSITNERLTLTYAKGQTGKATITVQAVNTFGISTQTTFTVTVGA